MLQFPKMSLVLDRKLDSVSTSKVKIPNIFLTIRMEFFLRKPEFIYITQKRLTVDAWFFYQIFILGIVFYLKYFENISTFFELFIGIRNFQFYF